MFDGADNDEDVLELGPDTTQSGRKLTGTGLLEDNDSDQIVAIVSLTIDLLPVNS